MALKRRGTIPSPRGGILASIVHRGKASRRSWVGEARALALGMFIVDIGAAIGLVYILFDFLSASASVQGAQPTPSSTWVTFFSTFIGVDAALLVTGGVVAVGLAPRIREWPRLPRWVVVALFLFFLVYLFVAVMENALAMQVAGWASTNYFSHVASTDYIALALGLFVVASSVMFAVMPTQRPILT